MFPAPQCESVLAVTSGGGEAFLLWGLVCLLPMAVLAVVAGYVTSRPYRQQFRSEFLLDVIESAVREGRNVEQRIMELAETRDLALGVPFHMLAGYLRRGWSLVPALERVPALAPPQLSAMLEAGRELGDLLPVIPSIRAMLRDGPSQSLASINYQVMLAFVFNPLILLLVPFLSWKVLPVFGDILSGFGRAMPPAMEMYIRLAPPVFLGLLVLVCLLYAFSLLVLGGPRLIAWVESGLPPVSHWIWTRVPWRRKRLLRDFVAMLGLLLDAGVPEARAVTLAAGSLANRSFEARAVKMVRRLEAGDKLAAALGEIDDSGELGWRLRNAAHGAGFRRALAGWQESLDARAFRQEQGAAQLITTVLLLLNGVTVALVAAAIFSTFNVTHTISLPLK